MSRGKVQLNVIIKDKNLDPYYLSKDRYCYTIFKSRTKGKYYVSSDSKLGFYPKLGDVLKKISTIKVQEDQKEYTSINSYLQTFQNINDELKTLMEKLKIDE